MTWLLIVLAFSGTQPFTGTITTQEIHIFATEAECREWIPFHQHNSYRYVAAYCVAKTS